MDKEALKKNKFWYLLGSFGLVFLIVFICALASSSEAAEKKAKDVVSLKKTITDQNGPGKKVKNTHFLGPWETYKQQFAEQKDKVWSQAWEAQQAFYQWPTGGDPPVDFNKLMLYAADSKQMTLPQRELYQKIYKKQFDNLKLTVAPAVFKNGEGNIGFGNSRSEDGGFNSIMGPTMAGGNRGPGGGGTMGDSGSYTTVLEVKDNMPAISPEEIWIVQEDFWVKREMLNIIRTAQQSVGRFKRIEGKKDEAKLDGVLKTQRFSNGIWEFTIHAEQPKDKQRPVISARSTIANVSPTHAVLPLSGGRGTKPLVFWLTQKGIRYKLEVAGEALPWGEKEKRSLGERANVDTLDLTSDFEMEQEFDWSNAPVRRIDALLTAKQSHRTAKCALVPNRIFKEATDKGAAAPGAAAPGAPAPGPGGAPQQGKPGAPGQGSLGPTGPGAGTPGQTAPGGESGADSAATIYHLERNRYIMSTDQARHLPIAMVLVVEPAHINDVLIAVANSPLRIQTTQVAFQKTSVKAPRDPADEKSGGSRGGQPNALEDAPDTNLVELTVYGIATLYERPKPPEEKPATPGGPQTKPPAGKP